MITTFQDQNIELDLQRYEPIDPGNYRAKITSIVRANGEFGPQLKFSFLLDPLHGFEEGKSLLAWCSEKFSPKSKLYKWTTAIMGPAYDHFRALDLVGKEVNLLVNKETSADGTQIHNTIVNIAPVKAAAPVRKLSEQQILAELGYVTEGPAVPELPQVPE